MKSRFLILYLKKNCNRNFQKISFKIEFYVILDVENGKAADVVEMGIMESYNVKLCMLSSAAEATEMVIIYNYLMFFF